MKFWNRNYTLVIIGQIISLFANNILHLAMTLHVLDLLGSGYAFVITAISMIPMVLFMPFGGILADRINKKKIMVAMDVLTGLIVLSAFPSLASGSPVLFITLILGALSILEAFYTPCVQASIPVLQEPENLVKGNAVVNQISMAANVAGAVTGGILYGFLGIRPILVGCLVCFLTSALLETFIIIKHVTHSPQAFGLVNIVRADLKEAAQFLVKEQRSILKLIPSVTAVNFSLTSMLTVAVPYLVRITLGLSSQLYGLAVGLIAMAGILGGLAAARLANKLKTKFLYRILILTGISIFPIGLAFLATHNRAVLYVTIIFFLMVCEACCSIFSIYITTTIELATPTRLLGKVMSFIVAVSICAEPLGRGAYGLFFQVCREHVSVVLFGTALFITVVSFTARKPLGELDRAS